MPLDLASAGETPEGARQAVDETVRLFLTTAAEHGTLEEVVEGRVGRVGRIGRMGQIAKGAVTGWQIRELR
jgi:hypothetical protein